MVVFERLSSTRLYSSTSTSAAGWWGFQIPEGTSTDHQSVPLAVALADPDLKATFVYAATPPDLSSPAAFIQRIDEIMGTIIQARALILLPTGDASRIKPEVAVTVALTQAGSTVRTAAGRNIVLTGVPGITAQLAANSVITINEDGDGLVFDAGDSPSMSLGGLGQGDTFQPDNLAVLRFAGPAAGTFGFTIFIGRRPLFSKLNWGFQTLAPNPDKSGAVPYFVAWLPLADAMAPNPSDKLGFAAQINLVNPNNLLPCSPTRLLFTGQNSDAAQTILASYYRTNAGKVVTLYPETDTSLGQEPAALVINPGYGKTPIQNGYSFAPHGDFVMATGNGQPATVAYLLCGMTGTETITFSPFAADNQPGYRIRFSSNMPAYAFPFPLQPSSPVGPPIDPTALPLDRTYLTSWATVISGPTDSGSPLYTAAPKGADLFGHSRAMGNGGRKVLNPVGPGVALTPGAPFPLLPLAGFIAGSGGQDLTSAELAELDRQILSPTRRAIIAATSTGRSPSAEVNLGRLTGESAACPFNATTPAGFISHVLCDGSWDQLLLAQVTEPSTGQVTLQMGFTKLQNELQSAFQTDNLFLVVGNNRYVGAPASGTFMPPARSVVYDKNLFFDTITLGDWRFEAKVGTQNQYGDYRNIMIVKGVKGKLVDLATCPEEWTMKDRFAAPSTTRPDGTVSDPDIAQLIPLSSWLTDYLRNATEQAANPFFTHFSEIINDESWTGVLILRADISSVPKDLAGVIAGVNDPTSFYAHHIGIEISPLDGQTVQQKGSSSLFGLIYYVDPSYDDSGPPAPIPRHELDAPYDFTLLTLKALFQNSSLKKFESLAEVILNRVFGSAVATMEEGGNIYNAILLQGAFQKNGEAPVYSLSSSGTNVYRMDNNILRRVEVDSAVMSTRDDGSTTGEVVSWIALSGFMDLAVITDRSGSSTPLPDFDIFSFGTALSGATPRQGLNFNNLGLQITFLQSGAGDSAQATDRAIEMVEAEISFNMAASTPRTLSLYRNFELELLSLQSGDKTTTPQALGYLTVATPYGLQGVSNGAWHGLRCKLNLGTPGALASKVNLSSSLLVAWSDTSGSGNGASGYQALVGIELPGAGSGGGLFSLQSVIRLSVGVVQLYYNQSAQSFLLLLNEIALKLLGLLKLPPNGATAFFLFGNPGPASTGLGWYTLYNQDQPKLLEPEADASVALPRAGRVER